MIGPSDLEVSAGSIPPSLIGIRFRISVSDPPIAACYVTSVPQGGST